MASTIPTPCTEIESTVISAPIDIVWGKFRQLKLDDLAPKFVKATSVKGDAGVGSIVKVSYSDGSVWELLITEISERKYTIGYEVLSSDPAPSFTSAEGELSFQKVSDSNHTFVKWTTIFSNDADAQVIQDQKYKKLDFFEDFKKHLVV